MRLLHEFVTHIPENLEEGVLYVSLEFATVVHKCACGCGAEVVTPLGPGEWRLTYDQTVSLAPSVGNWSFPCRSHYWIESGQVRWARSFSNDDVALIRRKAKTRRDAYYLEEAEVPRGAVDTASGAATQVGIPRTLLEALRALFRSSGRSS